MRNVFGPDISPALAITTGPTGPPPGGPAQPPSGKKDIAIDFKGVTGTGPAVAKFGLPVYDPATFNKLVMISVVAIPIVQGATLPTTADGWLAEPTAQVARSGDLSAQTTGGEVAVSCSFVQGQYVAKSILTFDA